MDRFFTTLSALAAAFGSLLLGSAQADGDSINILTLEAGREVLGAVDLELSLSDAKPSLCRTICEGRAGCKGYSFYPATEVTKRPVCKILKTVTQVRNAPSIVSGTYTQTVINGSHPALQTYPDVSFNRWSGASRTVISCPTSSTFSFDTTRTHANGWERSYASISGKPVLFAAIVSGRGTHASGKELRCYYGDHEYIHRPYTSDLGECLAYHSVFSCHPLGGYVDFSETVELSSGDAGVDFTKRPDGVGQSVRDLSYMRQNSTARLLQYDMRIARFRGNGEPTDDQCINVLEAKNENSITISETPEGTWYCYLTKEERLGKFRIDAYIGNTKTLPDKVRLTYYTWQKEEYEDRLPIAPPSRISPAARALTQDNRLATTIITASKEKSFTNPSVKGHRVDWCLNFGDLCGKPAADKFCQLKGFKKSASHKFAPDVGPTMTLGDKRNCTAQSCDSFQEIVCTP